jgi:hypothetical protein
MPPRPLSHFLLPRRQGSAATQVSIATPGASSGTPTRAAGDSGSSRVNALATIDVHIWLLNGVSAYSKNPSATCPSEAAVSLTRFRPFCMFHNQLISEWATAMLQRNIPGFPYPDFESPPLRQSRQSGHSFSAAPRGLEARRMRAFAAICPNHRHRPRDRFRAAFRLSRPTFSEATEPRPFWYGCWKLSKSKG